VRLGQAVEEGRDDDDGVGFHFEPSRAKSTWKLHM
jgi:hypothetical protein